MGEKKTCSIKSFIKISPGISIQEANLKKAIINEDLKTITRTSIFLLSEHRDLAKIFHYSERLLREEKLKIKPQASLSFNHTSSRISNDWMKYKISNNIKSDEIVDTAVIDSVTNVIFEGR